MLLTEYSVKLWCIALSHSSYVQPIHRDLLQLPSYPLRLQYIMRGIPQTLGCLRMVTSPEAVGAE